MNIYKYSSVLNCRRNYGTIRKLSSLSHDMNFNSCKPRLLLNIFDAKFARKHYATLKKLNYYDVLELTPKANQAQIKQAYYRLSMKYHPDQTMGDEVSAAKFREIYEAYQTLVNVNKRKLYDKGFAYSNVAPNVEQQKYSKTVYQARTHSGKAPMTGRTDFYNFDQWYKGHFERTQTQKEFTHQRKAQQKSNFENTQNSDLQLKVFMSIFTVVFLLQYLLEYVDFEFDLMEYLKDKPKKKD